MPEVAERAVDDLRVTLNEGVDKVFVGCGAEPGTRSKMKSAIGTKVEVGKEILHKSRELQ